MPKHRTLFILLVMIALLVSGCGSPVNNNKLNWQVEDFTFTNQDGQPFGLKQLQGKVWLADFIFTNCTTVCPPMTNNMSRLQQKFKDAGVDVDIVSFTVDPERDQPDVLKAYAENYEADFSNWHFLTGYTQDEIKKFSEGSFRSLVQNDDKSDQVFHGTSFFLVDASGVIVRRYEGAADPPYEDIIKEVKSLNKKASASTKKQEQEQSLQMVEVAIVLPERIKVEEQTTISAKVTQGDDNVDDALDVLFEIWKDDQEDHDRIEGKHQKNGIYAVEKSFTEPGTYYIISHVTARGMHVMPKQEFQVASN